MKNIKSFFKVLLIVVVSGFLLTAVGFVMLP